MITVTQLIEELKQVSVSGPRTAKLTRVVADSRQVKAGDIFCALPGEKVDGATFIDQAIDKGAAAIVAETKPTHAGVTWFHTDKARRTMAEIAAAVHDHPSRQLRLAGITGTNGKTTTAFLLHHLMQTSRGRAGLIGTVRYFDGKANHDATHTTPESPELQAMLSRMVKNSCYGAAMEVSSHALALYRSHAIEFDAAIFTNLTQDHLDFHQTMEEYFQAKKILFQQIINQGGKKKPVAVINVEDQAGRRLLRSIGERVKVFRYGFGVAADFRAANVVFDPSGTTYQLETGERKILVRLPLIGRFNVMNSLAALAGGVACGLNLRESVKNLALAPQVPGRLESVIENRPFKVFVDYAHTPDALQNALTTLRELNPRRLITVFGCGGDRDKSKRPQMGAVAGKLSDVVIITSDNPRSESPAAIIADIQKGLKSTKALTIEDRADAIHEAISLAEFGDIVLIAGKGHENYQIFADRTIDFDDRKIARQAARHKLSPIGEMLAEEKKRVRIEAAEKRRSRPAHSARPFQSPERSQNRRDDRAGERPRRSSPPSSGPRRPRS